MENDLRDKIIEAICDADGSASLAADYILALPEIAEAFMRDSDEYMPAGEVFSLPPEEWARVVNFYSRDSLVTVGDYAPGDLTWGLTKIIPKSGPA